MKISLVNKYAFLIPSVFPSVSLEYYDVWSFDVTIALNGAMLIVVNNSSAFLMNSPTASPISLGSISPSYYVTMDPSNGAIYQIQRSQPLPQTAFKKGK